jgi:hypothetical protein
MCLSKLWPFFFAWLFTLKLGMDHLPFSGQIDGSMAANVSQILHLAILPSFPKEDSSGKLSRMPSPPRLGFLTFKGLTVGVIIDLGTRERVWKTWAPPKCRFFVWLVAHNRCWTADHLARRGLPHPERCPLCDQNAETIDHILVLCVFAREFWYRRFSWFGLQTFAPQPTETSFHLWWEMVSSTVGDMLKKGMNSPSLSLEPGLYGHTAISVFLMAQSQILQVHWL